jgi:DNA repair protein RadA/Sms
MNDLMAKNKTVFICQQCGVSFSKWMGKCTDCGTWNSLIEEKVAEPTKKISQEDSPKLIQDLLVENVPRVSSSYKEFDAVLGGGLVRGSLVLIGGEPGIGKSTLLLQVASNFASTGHTVLYVSGEESASQIALRAKRLGIADENLYIYCENSLTQIENQIDKIKPSIFILDSIQTVMAEGLDSNPGSVGQLRECTYQILSIAKSKNIATFLVGHVTKEGAIAGPKVLEHMVDVVLYFENSNSQNYRLLRSIKNRYGSTNELGVFEMQSSGMIEVTNPSEIFLSEDSNKVPGTTATACLEGTRPLLVEVQALVSQSYLAIPRRTSLGYDPNRLNLLVAILEKRAGYKFYDQDVYLNIAGGLKLQETSADLAIAASIISSFSGKMGNQKSVLIGEVGLGGEVRQVANIMTRVKESERVGFTTAYIPEKAFKEIKRDCRIELIPISNVRQLSDYF